MFRKSVDGNGIDRSLDRQNDERRVRWNEQVPEMVYRGFVVLRIDNNGRGREEGKKLRCGELVFRKPVDEDGMDRSLIDKRMTFYG